MSGNEIIDDIRRTRDEHARECGYDVHVLFEQMRAETEKLKAEGWRIVSPAQSENSPMLREEPPTDFKER